MSQQIQKNVAQVERRLLAARTLSAWPWCASASFALAAVAILVDKFYPLGMAWSTLLGAATGLSLAAALGWSWLRRGDATAAAIELDRRCHLEERVSTALALASAPADDRAAAAVRADAERALERVSVSASFPLQVSRRWAWPLLPLGAALAATQFVASVAPPVVEATPPVMAQVRESAADLERKLAEQRRQAERLQLTEAQKLLEQLQEEARQLRDADKMEAREALVKLNDLAQKLADRREQVAGAKEMQKQLSRLRSKESGPAEKFTQSLSRGNYRDAAAQLQELRKQLQTGKLNDEQQQKLTKQLDELQKQVEDLAKAQEQRNEDLKKQLAEQQARSPSKGEQKKGPQDESQSSAPNPAELSKRLAEAAEQAGQLGDMQQALAEAAKQLEQGDAAAARESLGKMQDQLDQLGDKLEEMRLLDEGMLNVDETKTELAQGEGKEKEPGPGKSKGQGAGQGNPTKQPGQGGLAGGAGDGIGNQPGDRPENPTVEDDKGLFDSRVRAQAKAGEMRIVGPTDGPNAKGRALEVIRAQTESVAEQGPATTLDRQPLDRSRRDQKRQYFDALRKGE